MPEEQVCVVMGSRNDRERLQGTLDLLREFNVPFEVRVISAHRTPEVASEYFSGLKSRGMKVAICAAGGAAHLAGAAAAHTTLPVIGIPLDASPLKGMDALLSTVQMPPGIPVATVSIGEWGGRNAALLAISILALSNPELDQKLVEYRERMKKKILNTELQV